MIPNESKVFLVGAGPGDPDLLTVKAHTLLRSADLILHDDLVPAPILALAGPQAMVVNVGKRCGVKKITQFEINHMMIAAARRGMTVVRLKSGDPGIFGRLAEELDALEAASIPFEVVPGITAGVAAAASLRVSLTDRRKSSRIVIVSGHRAQENERAEKPDWKALASEDTTLVIYMPGRDLTGFARELLDAGLSPTIPAVVVSRASTPQQREWCTTLAGLPAVSRADAPSILLIGRPLERAAQRTNAARHAPGLDGELNTLLQLIGAESSASSHNENPQRRLAQ
ncbi:MAG TPA: uroporphyrinogen-III C-methyltransferase [Candidatus Limnocylindria bacterium]|nr:uroporphyrinogen-III C-methyltransferase [Candidatus Limnocylindria bacterium]